MSWRQYEKLSDDLKNIAFKLSFAPLFRRINATEWLNQTILLPQRIVICGCPRSGTTLMNELLRSFSDIQVLNRETYALQMPYLLINKKYVVTKHPLDYKNFSDITKTFRNPIIIYMLRDPRDVIISKHYKNKDLYLIT